MPVYIVIILLFFQSVCFSDIVALSNDGKFIRQQDFVSIETLQARVLDAEKNLIDAENVCNQLYLNQAKQFLSDAKNELNTAKEIIYNGKTQDLIPNGINW